MNKVDVITCMTWVPKGKAKSNPDKIELNEEELQKVIDETKDESDDLKLNEHEDEYDFAELHAIKDEISVKPSTFANNKTKPVDEEMKDLEVDKFEKEYDLQKYDNELDITTSTKLGHLVVHASSKGDPYLLGDEDSDEEDEVINESDNVIIAGRFDGDASCIEAYVYNPDEGYYIHHDFLIPSTPLCMEWLNYNPRDENLAPGNLVAIGDMTPAINVWDLNCMGAIEPAYSLGFSKRRKKEKMGKVGHSKRVLCLAWNTEMEHILASGSVDESVILWDLETAVPAGKFTDFTDKVQCIKWNPNESHSLLTGCCDKYVRLFDCRSNEIVQKWKVKGEVESLTWDAADNIFIVSTDRGYVYVIDSRQPTPKYYFKAHESVCSGIAINTKCPGCLVTVGEDSFIKVWDAMETEATLVYEFKSKLGSIRTVTTSPNDPFVYSFGGDGKQPFKVWDIRNSLKIRQRFCPRMNLPVDDNNDSSNSESEEEQEENELEEDTTIVKRLKESLNKNLEQHDGSKKKRERRLKKH